MSKSARFVAFLILALPAPSFAADRLVILAPHRKTIQEEFVPAFTKYYEATYKTPVAIEWIDQGGASNAVRYLASKLADGKATAGIDVFWGGTSANFVDMARAELLAPFALPKEARRDLPELCAGVPLSDGKDLWHASAISSFGIMFNKAVLEMDRLPEPKTWSDLARPAYFDNLMLTDPRHSGTNSTMHYVILQSQGWEKGWETLVGIAGNTRRYTHSSSDPVRAVVTGEAAASMVIDFYGLANIWDLGEEKLGFVLPAKETVLDPDPVAIVRGAPNRKVAERLVTWLMTVEAQRLWLLPKGATGGPTRSNLARLAVNPRAYEATQGQRFYVMNPFEQKEFLEVDMDKAGAMRRVLNDYVGATLVDPHKSLKSAWRTLIKTGAPKEAFAWLARPQLGEAEMLALEAKWDDEVERNRRINAWTKEALARYEAVRSGQRPWERKAH